MRPFWWKENFEFYFKWSSIIYVFSNKKGDYGRKRVIILHLGGMMKNTHWLSSTMKELRRWLILIQLQMGNFGPYRLKFNPSKYYNSIML